MPCSICRCSLLVSKQHGPEGSLGALFVQVMQKGCRTLCGWMMCSHSCVSLSLACCAGPHADGMTTAPHSKGQVCDACCSIRGVSPSRCPVAGGADATAMAEELRQHLLSMVSYKVGTFSYSSSWLRRRPRQFVLGTACRWACEAVGCSAFHMGRSSARRLLLLRSCRAQSPLLHFIPQPFSSCNCLM